MDRDIRLSFGGACGKVTVKKTAKNVCTSINVAIMTRLRKRSKIQHYTSLRKFLYNETELCYDNTKAPPVRTVGAFLFVRQKKSSKIYAKIFLMSSAAAARMSSV